MSAEIETPSVPSRLYRYRSLGKGLGSKKYGEEISALTGSAIWCGHYKKLNDAMEGITLPSTLLSEDELLYEKLSKQLTDKMGSFGVSSFSESHKLDPMWAHYANNFNGIVVCYNFRTLLSSLPNDCSFVRVSYSDQAPLLKKGTVDISKAAKTALSTKNPRWINEREWRLISKKQGLVSFDDPKSVISVYIGARVEDKTRNHLITQLRQRNRGVRIWQMHIDGYAFSFKPARRTRTRTRILPIV